MKRFTMFACLALTLVFAMNAFASDLPQRVIGHDSVFHGGNAEFAKSGRDTVFLIGPASEVSQVNGEFELNGSPNFNGWTHWDVTQPTETHWQVSDYFASELNDVVDNMAAYCGDVTYVACDLADPVGGYGNNWNDILRFTHSVDDPLAGCTLTVSGVFSSNTEPAYDFVKLRFMAKDAPVLEETYDGVHVARTFTKTNVYAVADYFGAGADEVGFEVLVTSDGGWSDEDCDYWGNGACQIDDLVVTVSNGGYTSTSDFQDGYGDDWGPAFPNGVGDFTQLWTGLNDTDPCNTNTSTQVAYIDDGTVIAGVGPSYCQDWCYGPGGYIVNTTGGATLDGHMLTELESPVMTTPGGEYTGFELTYGVYRHEDLSADAPGMFYSWNVRSSVLAEDITEAAWLNRNFVYYGGPDYSRPEEIVTDLILPGAGFVQVQLELNELGWIWGWDGDDGYPAPYFDNVRFTAYTAQGPGMSTREIDLAQDNFSESKLPVNLGDLASNNVRFDGAMAKTPASALDLHNVPRDSILVDVASVRVGGQLVVNHLVYEVDANPVFDSVRTFPMSGTVDALQIGLTSTYSYDLPDSGFLFPGDVLHYYIEAADEVAHADRQYATLPADIDGFGDFSRPLAYDTGWQVHALPSVNADGSQPGMIFWNDFADRGGENEWHNALNNLGYRMGEEYDVYYTNGPSSGVGNGIGGRATDTQLDGYDDMLYTAGDLGVNTIANGDFNNDASNDIQVLISWLDLGERDMFLSGDELVSDLSQAGALTSGFVLDYMNVQLIGNDVRPFINNQTTPVVLPVTSNSVFFTTPSWIAFGGCNGINTFDAVNVGANAERLARFTNPSGTPDYDFSAATLNQRLDDRFISMPYDLMFVYTNPNDPIIGGLATRVNVLKEVLAYLQVPGPGPGQETPVTPGAGKFFAKNYPNPFNPSTEIKFNMPKAGHLSLKIYNVRGELVKTLIDETRAVGAGHIMWDGTNSQGSNVSSGVYFYEARTAGEVQVSKMALVK